MARHLSTLSTRHNLHPELNPAEWVAVTARRSAQTSDFTLSSLKDPPWEMIGAASSSARPARSSGSPRPTIVIVCPLLPAYSWRSFSSLSLSCPVQILKALDFMDSGGVIVEPEQLHVRQSELWPICQSELWHLQAVLSVRALTPSYTAVSSTHLSWHTCLEQALFIGLRKWYFSARYLSRPEEADNEWWYHPQKKFLLSTTVPPLQDGYLHTIKRCFKIGRQTALCR